jgi:hypothetical protein
MDISTKYKIVEKIINSEDELLLGEIKDLLEVSEKDFWNGLSESTKNSINRGLDESRRGLTRPHDEVISETKNRFLNQ